MSAENDARELVETARAYVRTYARIMARDVAPEQIDAIVAAVGDISILTALDELARLQHAQHPEDQDDEEEPTKKTKHKHDIAIDADGSVIPMTPADVRRMTERIFDEGDLLAIVLRAKNGDLAVQVFGPPSKELADTLTTAARNLRRALKGH